MRAPRQSPREGRREREKSQKDGTPIFISKAQQAAGDRGAPEILSPGSEVALAGMTLWPQEEQGGSVALCLEA